MYQNSHNYRLANTPEGAWGVQLFFILFALLTLATWLLGLSDWRFATSDVAPIALTFHSARGKWVTTGNVTIDESGVTLLPTEKGRVRSLLYLELTDPGQLDTGNNKHPTLPVKGASHLLLRYAMQSETPARTLHSTKTHARLLIRSYSDETFENKLQAHSVAVLDQTRPVATGDYIVRLLSGARFLSVEFRAQDRQGRYRLSTVEFQSVEETLRYRVARMAGIVGWVAWAAFLGMALLNRADPRLVIVAGLSIAAIVAGIMLPETIQLKPFRGLLKFLAGNVSGGTAIFKPVILYKAGHFLFFMTAAWIALAFRKRLAVTRQQIVLFFVLLAIATEGFQLHLLDRTTLGLDVLIDTSGVLLAFALVAVSERRHSRAND